MNPALSQHWNLDDVHFLNHGSFGASPRVVLETQAKFREQMEAEPVRFFVRELAPLYAEARRALANFVGAPETSMALVDNATTGVNTVLRSLTFGPGDEIVVSNQEYNACRNAAGFVTARSGAKIVTAHIPFPIQDPSQVRQAFADACTPRTRLILIDHVVSQTGFVLPVAEVIADARNRGIEVLVDGAHAPGMLPLDLSELRPTYYTGNCHKWMCAPKTVAFLYVDPERLWAIRPLTISHGANAAVDTPAGRFRAEFDWTGTRDPTAALSLPACIAFMDALHPDGWDGLMHANSALVKEGRALILDVLDQQPTCPDSMVGSLATIRLPDASVPQTVYPDPAQTRLLEEFNIEVPFIPWPKAPKRLLRISAQIYNDLDDYRALAQALPRVLA